MKRKYLVLVAIAVLCLASLAFSRTALQGPAFSSPGKTFHMPASWVKKPLKYDAWAKGADISVTLEQDVYQMVLPLIDRFAKQRGVKIAVKEGTCGMAAGMLSRKTIDIGGFCCPPSREDRLPGLKFHTLGIVAIAFIVNRDNPVGSLSVQQLRDVFQGRLHRWSELKNPDGKPGPAWPVMTVGRLHCPLRPGHWRLLLGNSDLFGPNLYEVGSIPDGLSLVEENKRAIGWETLGMIEHYGAAGKVKPVRINGFTPTDSAALASGKYPFYRTYNLTTWGGSGNTKNSKARELVGFLMKELARHPPAGFVPASMLRRAGWKFKGEELTGSPH
ncbi:MAG: substrate-binding domain-containing protein [Actinomycetota bacterium]|nr:substrate-binding domain-containing protein [Actinomycetota bacterium]